MVGIVEPSGSTRASTIGMFRDQCALPPFVEDRITTD